MKAKKVNIGTNKNDYWFYDCEIEFAKDELAITSKDMTAIVRVSEIIGIKIETED